MKNISHVSGKLSFYLDNTASFSFQPETLTVHPKESQFLVVSSNPAEHGVQKAKLLLIMKENPVVETISLECNGCDLIFNISPKKITFERVIVNNRARKILTLMNMSLVPLNWKIANKNLFSKQYYFPFTYGYIKPCENVEVVIEYMSDIAEEVPKQHIEIQIFDEFCKSQPLVTEYVELSAESCDLLVTCEPHVDFGSMKARDTYTHKLQFTNKGKYQLFLELNNIDRVNMTKKDIKTLDLFQINTRNASLHPQKPVTIFMTFNPKGEMTLKDYPVFKCTIFDNIQKEVVVIQEFFITVDAQTFFSK